MALNAKWHAAHPLQRSASTPERVAWHLEHQDQCACRPIPASLRAAMHTLPPPKLVSGAPPDDQVRCPWATSDPLYIRYHDEEWGVPAHDDRHLFEMLILEGAQAGLAWITILRKRDGYRRAFDGFDARKISSYDAKKRAMLMADAAIVRNRLKIESAVDNARAFREVQKEFGSFDQFIWGFVGGTPKVNRPKSMKDVPPRTPASDAMSKALKKRGFRFVGSTICYAFMQACGLVDDHVATCFRSSPAPRTVSARGARPRTG